MEQAFITPMQPIGSLEEVWQINSQRTGRKEENNSVFKDVIRGVVNDVVSTQKDLEEKQYLLATGQLDDVHMLPIASARAGLAVDLMVQLRNKAMDAYNEIMRISL